MYKVKESFADYLNFQLGQFIERQIPSPENPSLPQFATGTVPETSGHTPGPWMLTSIDEYNVAYRFHADVDFPDIAEVFIRNTDAECDGNARLIKTAPKLLAFARSARNAFKERLDCLDTERIDAICDGDDECCGDIDDQIGNYQYLLGRAEAVIAEAEGR
jgi:hypothetical protein